MAVQGPTGCATNQWRFQPDGYLRAILTARVYDVAVSVHVGSMWGPCEAHVAVNGTLPPCNGAGRLCLTPSMRGCMESCSLASFSM